MRINIGARVVLSAIPSGLLHGLPTEDQAAILAAIGSVVEVTDVDDAGRVEVEFTDQQEITHSIWIPPEMLAAID